MQSSLGGITAWSLHALTPEPCSLPGAAGIFLRSCCMISFHKLKSVWLHGTVVEIMSLPQQGECQHSSPARQHVDTPCFEKFLNRSQVSGRQKQSLFLHKSDRLIMRNPHYRRAIHAAVVSVCQSCHRQPFFSGFCRGVKIRQTLLLAEY